MRDSALTWQNILANGFVSAKDLLDFLGLADLDYCKDSQQEFVTRVPRGFAELMEPGNPLDPLLLQVLPNFAEQQSTDGYVVDPLGESQKNILPGLMHKYDSRVLLTVTGACAINCRFCFRRHFPYAENNPGRKGWQQVFAYIEENANINEVILSGGDPLLASDSLLQFIFAELAKIPHVNTVRFHTRIPVVLPERINTSFLDILANTRLASVMVLHCNHSQELSDKLHDACLQLRNQGCYLLNQSVLLRRVNDSVSVLADLSHKLFEMQVLPYYLHMLDKTKGTEHFAVKKSEVFNIFQGLKESLPGYLVPKLVCEESGQKSKTWLSA